jgi:spore maturation protein CgeB
MNITAVVVIRNEANNLIRYFEHVKLFCNEIIVVDQQSTDTSVQLAMQYADKVIISPNIGYNELDRKYACSLASNDWICTLDPDEIYCTEFVKELPNIMAKAKEECDGIICKIQNVYDGILIEAGGYEQIRLAKKNTVQTTRIHTGIAVKHALETNYIQYHFKDIKSAIEKEDWRSKHHDDDRIKDNIYKYYKDVENEIKQKLPVIEEERLNNIKLVKEKNEHVYLKGEKVKILILGNMSDQQTGMYILDACRKFSSNTAGIDIRRITQEIQSDKVQECIKNECTELSFTPDIIIVLKGMEISYDTLKWIKSYYPHAKMMNWFFDILLFDKPIWEEKSFFDIIKIYDYFICAHRGVSNKLKEVGFDNAVWIEEACSVPFNGEVYMNNFQKKKYESEIAFVGTLGLTRHHKNRIPILKKIVDNGFNLKIYGKIACKPSNIPVELKTVHTQLEAINDVHSLVCQGAIINLGLDVDNKVDHGYSARLFRVLCAGGFYLSEYVIGMEDTFKINKQNEQITDDLDFVVFYNEDDMITKIDYLLTNPDLCKKIGKNGQKTVIEKHTFEHRVQDIIKLYKNK